jgi:TRAP transporter TAXI family solute receptor
VLLGTLAGLGVGAGVAFETWRDAPSGRLSIGAGPRGAAFLDVGSDLAAAIQGSFPQVSVAVRVTAASVENLRMLAQQTIDVGFVSLDAAMQNVNVREQEITAVSRVYDSSLQLVVPAESHVRNLSDLQGLRVSVGGSGSGTEFTSTLLLSSLGVAPARMVRSAQLPSVAAIEAGTLDAIFSLTGTPTPAISDLAARRRIRLIPLAEHFWVMDRAIPRAYTVAPIPADTYQDVPSVDTLVLPNLLMGRSGLPRGMVDAVLRAMFDDGAQRFWRHPESRGIALGLAREIGGVTMAPEAQSWLDHRGV